MKDLLDLIPFKSNLGASLLRYNCNTVGIKKDLYVTKPSLKEIYYCEEESLMQGVKFLFFPIFSYFSQHTPIFPIF